MTARTQRIVVVHIDAERRHRIEPGLAKDLDSDS
jgi:hypothetical protein